MFAFGGILRHFRGGVPGAPSPAGVPIDRRSELERELKPVFAALEQVQAQGRSARVAAKAAAQARRERASAVAAATVTRAQAEATAEQSAAAAARLTAARTQGASIEAAGLREAERVARDAGVRMPELADRLLALVLETPA